MHSTYLQVQEGHNVPTGDYKTMSLEYRVQDGMLMVVATTAVQEAQDRLRHRCI